MNFVMAANQVGAGDKISVLPTLYSFIILVVVVIEMIVAGFFLKRKWLETHETLPIPAALAMMFLMMSLYMLVGSALYWSNPVENRPQILFWLLVLYIPLCFQYGLNVVNAIVWRAAMRVSPVGVEIPDSPVVAQARKLLLSGKIDDAVALYTTFYERKAPALAEVARILKSEGKTEEAVDIYKEIVNAHSSDRVHWPEAAYSLGKLYETQTGQASKAIELYRRLLNEAPDSRFTHLAGADLARLMVMDAGFIKTLHEDEDERIPEDPFFAQRKNFLQQRMRSLRQEPEQHTERAEVSEAPEESEADTPEITGTPSTEKQNAVLPPMHRQALVASSDTKDAQTLKPKNKKRTTRKKASTKAHTKKSSAPKKKAISKKTAAPKKKASPKKKAAPKKMTTRGDGKNTKSGGVDSS